ncbi:putative leucine-rich repeat-containing protein DDB_G0290503 [Mizuhopecten yessoensis]|uniref:Uncharacterized protein n=1 Tax=Mizuhopecten yessoensis TaxID=6573 RepID=A0A210PNN0_MIZYE|nr:putative leucine-rich repeat-containing protein DDB_G0290503 [Mizuhopecten yessoensis]OWF38109.1 hypothetical protein KP79_PYT09137 [Mizuhopecten yessoensis]
MTDCKNELENYRKSLPKEDGSPDTPDTDMLKLQQECDSLKETIRLLEEENASSKTDSRESTNTMQKLQQECDSLKETIRLLEEENVSSKTDSQESTTTMEKLQQECDSLQETIRLLEEENVSSKTDSQESTNTMRKLQQECNSLQETIRLLEEENVSSKTDSQESTNTMQKLQQECSILKLQVEKLENERIELMKKVDIENNKMATLADEQSHMHDELTDVRYKIEQVPVLKDRCEKLEQEKESLFTELNSLKEEGKIKPEIQEIELQNLKETDSSLQQKLQQAEEEKMLLMSKVESLQSECREQSMDNGMATMEEECNRLREMVKQFEEEKLTSKTEEANSNEADSNQAMQKLQEECSILKLQIEKLESEGIESVGGSETESNKIALLEEECEVLRATVKDLADERLNMQDELTDVGHRIEQLPIMKEKCEELVQEKESLLMEIASLKEIGNAGPEMQEVELQILREKASNIQEQLESVEEEKMQMTLKLESLQSEFQENPLDNERAKLEEECEVLRATVNDLADERLNMQEELRDVGVKIEQLPVLKGKYEELLQEKESLLNEISSLKEEGKAEVEIQELELQKLREKANALEEKLDQVEEEKTDLTSKLENLQSEDHNTLAVNSMSKLEEECERLRETIRQLKEEKLPSKTEEADSNEAIQKLQEECSALKLQIEKLESEKDKSLEETDTESNKNATLEEEYEILRITVKDLIDERLDMQDELTEAGMKIEQLPILKEKCEELVQKNDSLLTEISLLKEGKSGTEMQEVELQILREKANSLQEQLESVKEERHSLISRLETLQSELENKNVDNAMAALEEECEILRATVKDLADERLNMQDELKDVGHKIEELPMLKEKCEKLLQEKESLIEMSLKKENAGPEMQEVELQILREKASHLQEQLELAEEEKNSLISRVESLQNESPEKPVEECERLRETIRLLEEENASSKTQAADSNDVLQKLQEECSVLKLQVEKIGTDRGESVERTDNDNNKIATLEGECEVLRATVKDLADECLNMQEKLTGIEQLPILKEKYEELVQEKAALLSEISSLKEEGETELDKPELELQNLREKASSLQEQLELAEEEKTSLISRLENIKTECQEQPKDSVVTVMEEECERLRETVKKLEEQNLPPKTEAADSNQAMQKLQEECSILKLQIEKLESERVQSVEGSDTENNKIATLEEECEILRATVKDLADERLNIQDELTDAGVKLEQVPILKEKCEELVQEKESLLVEISSMKEERNNTKSEMQEKCEKFEQTNNLLTAEISHLKQTNMSLEVEKTENVSSLQQQLEEVLGEKVHLKSCLEVLEKDCKEKQIAEEKYVGLKGKVKDLTDECLNLQKEITDLGVKAEQVPILKEKCEELVQEKDLLIQEVSSLREGTTKMERQSFEVRNLGEKVSNLQLQLEQSEQETLHLNSQLKQLETERHEKTVEIETCKSCYESLALEKKYLDEKVENLGRELAERISQQNAESGRVCVLLEEMSDMQENISQSEKERNEMEMKLEKSISELQVTQNQERENAICAKNNEIDQLKAEISTLKVQMEMEPSQQGLSCSVNMDTSTPWAEEKMELLKKIDVLKIERVKHARLMSEVNKIKEDKKMLISYCNDLEKQQQKAVDESDMGKKLKAAEADADKYYDLHNKQQTQIEEQKNLLSKSQTDMENMKAQFRETEKKLTEMQQTTAKQWEEIGEKKMEIFSQNRTIEEFEAKKQKLVQQYEETIDMKDNRIKKLQVEIRRRDAETSYMEPSSKAQKGDNSTSKENMPGGVVDQYNVFMLEAKNLRLEREVTKLNKRLKAVEDNPVTKPCSCPFQELSAKFEQQSGEKQRLQKEFDELKKKHIIKVGSREIDTSTINVPDVKVPTANPTEYSRHDDQLLSESKRRPNTNYPRKPFSDNECKQQ